MIILKAVLNIEELSQELQNDIADEIQEIREFNLEGAKELLEEHDIQIKPKDLFNYIRNGQENRIIRNEFYHPTNSPVLVGFDLRNYPRGNSNTRSDYLHGLQPNQIRPTAAVFNQFRAEKIINSLEEYLLNESWRPNHDKPFNDQDLTIIRKLLKILQELDTGREREGEAANTENLNKLFGNISAIEILEGQTRQKFYDYWEEINKNYAKLVEAFNTMEIAWLSNFTMDRLLEGSITLGSFSSTEVPDDVKEQIENIRDELAEKDVVIPNYVIRMPVISSEANLDEDKIKYLITSYLEFIGESNIPTNLRPYSQRVSPTIKLEEEAHKEEGEARESDQDRGSIEDPTMNTIETEEEEAQDIAQRRLETIKNYDEVDPYFAILLAKNPKLIKVNENTIEQAIEQISDLYEYGESNVGQEIKQLHLKQIDRFMNLYKTAANIANSPPFYLHLTDNPDNVKAIETALSIANQQQVGIQSNKIGENNIDTKTLSYKNAADYINTETIKLMTLLGEMIEVTNKTTRLPLKRPKGGKIVAEKQTAFINPSFIERSSTSGELNEKLISSIPGVLKALQEYYFTPLGSEFVVFDDLPEFATSTAFRKTKVILDKNYNNLLVKKLVEDEIMVVRDKDFDKITKFFKELRKGSEVEYNKLLADKATNAINGLMKVYGGLYEEKDDEDSSIRDIIIDRYEDLFGAILYDLAEADLSHEELISEKWGDHLLTYFVNRYNQQEYDLENLFTLLADPTYETLIAKSDSESNHVIDAVKRLKSELSRTEVKDTIGEISKAMLDTYDTLRMLLNKKVYKASLDIDDYDEVDFVVRKIQNENKVNIMVSEIESVLCKQESYEKIAKSVGFSEEIVYKIKGLFR